MDVQAPHHRRLVPALPSYKPAARTACTASPCGKARVTPAAVAGAF
jgi:hypothetical protein